MSRSLDSLVRSITAGLDDHVSLGNIKSLQILMKYKDKYGKEPKYLKACDIVRARAQKRGYKVSKRADKKEPSFLQKWNEKEASFSGTVNPKEETKEEKNENYGFFGRI